MGRQGYLIAVVGTFLIGCAVLLVVGCSGVQAETSQEEQGHTEATEQEQGHSGGAAPEEARCEGTRTVIRDGAGYLTNDVPGCPKGACSPTPAAFADALWPAREAMTRYAAVALQMSFGEGQAATSYTAGRAGTSCTAPASIPIRISVVKAIKTCSTGATAPT